LGTIVVVSTFDFNPVGIVDNRGGVADVVVVVVAATVARALLCLVATD